MKTEKEKEEQRHEEEIGETGEKHAKELQDLESNNNQKLMLEYEKYQELQVLKNNDEKFLMCWLLCDTSLLCNVIDYAILQRYINYAILQRYMISFFLP